MVHSRVSIRESKCYEATVVTKPIQLGGSNFLSKFRKRLRLLVAPFLPFAAPRTRTFSSSALLELEAPPCRFSFRSFPVCRSEFLSFRQLKPGKRNGQSEDSPKLPFELAYGERRGWAQSLTDRAVGILDEILPCPFRTIRNTLLVCHYTIICQIMEGEY